MHVIVSCSKTLWNLVVRNLKIKKYDIRYTLPIYI